MALIKVGLVLLAARAGLSISTYDSKAHSGHSFEFLSMGTSIVAVSKLVGVVISGVRRMELFKATNDSGRNGEAIGMAIQDLFEEKNCEWEIVRKWLETYLLHTQLDNAIFDHHWEEGVRHHVMGSTAGGGFVNLFSFQGSDGARRGRHDD